jgi:hypothetical protein
MHRRLDKSAAAVLAALVLSAFAAPELDAQDVADQAAAPPSAHSEATVRVTGNAAALEVHAHQSTVADVLSALAGFNIRYRAAVALNDVVDGVYSGSLERVLSRVLNGYDYAIRTDSQKVEVIVVGRSDDHAVPAPIVIPVRRRSD